MASNSDQDTEGVILALQQMTKDLDAFHKKAREVSSPSAGFKQLDTIFSTLSKTMLYSGGLAAAFYGVAKSLESVAQASVQLKAFANNTGFATSQVQDMQQGMRRMGMSAQEAQGQIAAFGDKLNNLMAFKEASDLWQNLSKSEGGAALANRMKDLVRAGNQMGAVSEYIRVFNLQTREGKIAMAQYAGMSIDTLENLATRMSRNVPIFQKSKEEMQRYHDMWVDLETRLNNIWGRISDKGIEHVNQMTEFLKAQGVNQNSIVKFIDEEINRTFRSIKDTVEEIKKIKEWYDNLFGKTYNQAEDPMGKDYQRRPENSFMNQLKGLLGVGSAKAATAPAQELIKVESDSNTLLRDVRDTLQRMEAKDEGEHAGGSPGGGRRALGRMLGIDAGGAVGGGGGGTTSDSPVPHPKDGAIRPPPERSSALPGISRAREALSAGAGRGGNFDPSHMDPMARAGSGLESDTSVVTSPGGARFRVKSEFAPNFQRFVDSYEKAGGVIGKNSGGLAGRAGNASYHPLGRAIDVNQVGYGIRGGGRSLPRELEEQLADEAGLYPGSKFRRRSDIGHFEVRNRNLALAKQREWMDQQQAGGARQDKFGKINASVEFLNVPNGVKTKASSEGDIFQQLQIGRTKQAGVYDEPFVGYE